MANYSNENQGFLARNERKRNDRDPDFNGSCEVGNPPVQMWIAGWINEGKPGSKMAGKRYFSLKFSPKDAARAPAPATQARDDDMAPTPIAGTKPATPQSPYETPGKPTAATPALQKLEDTSDVPF